MSEVAPPFTIGVLGGSGVYELDGLEGARWEKVESPFGLPSDEILIGNLAGVRFAFLPRHGRGHRIPPSEINYLANIDALKRVGVTDLISISAFQFEVCCGPECGFVGNFAIPVTGQTLRSFAR